MSSYSRRKGTAFESLIRDAFIKHLCPNALRAPRWGAKDKGDLVNIEFTRVEPVTILVTVPAQGVQLAVECKNRNQLSLPAAVKEAQVEAYNLGCQTGVVVHKRRGSTDPLQQLVTMTLADLFAIAGRPVGEADAPPP